MTYSKYECVWQESTQLGLLHYPDQWPADEQWHLFKCCSMLSSAASRGKISSQLTRVDKWVRRYVQAGLLVQVRKVSDAYTVAQQNNVVIAPFHGSQQIIEMTTGVHACLCMFTKDMMHSHDGCEGTAASSASWTRVLTGEERAGHQLPSFNVMWRTGSCDLLLWALLWNILVGSCFYSLLQKTGSA